MIPHVTAVVVVLALTISACGGSQKQRAGQRTAPTQRGGTRQPAPGNEILSLSALGTFEGRCPRGARFWTLRFIDDGGATDTVSYRVGTGPRRTVNVDPGKPIVVKLVPNATRTHEPADRFIPPAGQGRGLTRATTVPTTASLNAVIYQATEPQTLRADIHLALTTIGGESGQCVPVGSSVGAYTYPNSPGVGR